MTFTQRVGMAGLLFMIAVMLIEILGRLSISDSTVSAMAGALLWGTAFVLALMIISPNKGDE